MSHSLNSLEQVCRGYMRGHYRALLRGILGVETIAHFLGPYINRGPRRGPWF